MAIPQQKDTDLNDPRQRFVWAFQGLEFRGSPTAFPKPILEEWSEHLSKAGFIHVSQLDDLVDEYGFMSLYSFPFEQEIHYQPPIRGQEHSMNVSGKWVPTSQEIKQPVVPTSSLMTSQEKAKMIEEFREEGLID